MTERDPTLVNADLAPTPPVERSWTVWNLASLWIGMTACVTVGIVILPWKLIASSAGYIFTWLVGYSALLGPIGGILLADYFLLRGTDLDLEALYQRRGPHWYARGTNWRAVAALLLGVAPNVPGFLHAAGVVEQVQPVFDQLSTYSWFVGFFLAGGLYRLLMRRL